MTTLMEIGNEILWSSPSLHAIFIFTFDYVKGIKFSKP